MVLSGCSTLVFFPVWRSVSFRFFLCSPQVRGQALCLLDKNLICFLLQRNTNKNKDFKKRFFTIMYPKGHPFYAVTLKNKIKNRQKQTELKLICNCQKTAHTKPK